MSRSQLVDRIKLLTKLGFWESRKLCAIDLLLFCFDPSLLSLILIIQILATNLSSSPPTLPTLSPSVARLKRNDISHHL